MKQISQRTKIIIIVLTSLLLIVAYGSGVFHQSQEQYYLTPNNNNNNPSATKDQSSGNTNNGPKSWKEFMEKNSNNKNSELKVQITCQKSLSFEMPVGGALGLRALRLIAANESQEETTSSNVNFREQLYFGNSVSEESLCSRQLLQEQSLSELEKVADESMKLCRPTSVQAFQAAVDTVVGNSPGFFCPRIMNRKTKLDFLREAAHPVAKYLSIPDKEGDEIRKRKIHVILEAKNLSSPSSSSSSSQLSVCPNEMFEEGATVLECNEYFHHKKNISNREEQQQHTNIKSETEIDLEDIAESTATSLNLVRRVKQLLKIAPSTFSWSVTQQQSTTASSSLLDVDNNNNNSSTTMSSSMNFNEKCLLPELSGIFLGQVRQNLLKDRNDHELMLFSDAAYIAAYEKSVPPMINLPFFSNGRKFPAKEPLKYAPAHSEMTIKTGGFPTFEFSGSQPGLFAAVFTRAVVGFSYVFTCPSGRMYGNGGSKEHRFEFASSAIGGRSSGGGGKKKADKLPCRPLAAAFVHAPVKVAVPLCTSRYCRWYGIYHFMLEHLPQLTTALDVITQVEGAYLVVTEAPSLTTRSLLVDALGIPPEKIIAHGAVRADVAVLPTPGLVYRPMSHALRYFRRVILSRMGLDWTSSISNEKNKQSKQKNPDNLSTLSSSLKKSYLNPFSSGTNHSKTFHHFERRYCTVVDDGENNKNIIPEIRILLSERSAVKATAEQKQVRLPLNWQQLKADLRRAFSCVRFQTEKEVREDVRDTIFDFYEADIVLGIHGANLLFTSFMRKGSHLIEMISADASLNPRCFYNLATEVGVKYSAVLHDGAFKLQEYNYVLDSAMLIKRVNESIQDIRKRVY